MDHLVPGSISTRVHAQLAERTHVYTANICITLRQTHHNEKDLLRDLADAAEQAVSRVLGEWLQADTERRVEQKARAKTFFLAAPEGFEPGDDEQ